jgi:TorA maturation chaperone TorD
MGPHYDRKGPGSRQDVDGVINLKETSPSSAAKKNSKKWLQLSQSRANTYTLLSRVWGAEIDSSLYQQLRATTFPHMPTLPAMDKAYRSLEQALLNDSTDQLTVLAVDYARLCLGSDPREGADPYESVHRNKEGLMMQDDWEAVLLLYEELGLARTENTHESEDHLALELECMAQLCVRQEAALRAGELPEASWWLEQQARMLDDHLLRWVPSFVQRVEKLGRTDFYKAFGALTQEFLKMDRDILATQNTEPQEGITNED